MIASNKPTEQITLSVRIAVQTSEYKIMLHRSQTTLTKKAELRQSIRKLRFVHAICIVVPQSYQERLPLKEDNQKVPVTSQSTYGDSTLRAISTNVDRNTIIRSRIAREHASSTHSRNEYRRR